jgi:ornithine cyclodeaminase/alanine dehydrogenase-like protein (mu-crystallin family)
MTLVVGNEDVEQVLTLDDCFEVVETAYREMADGRAVNRARSHTYLPTSRPDVAYCLKSMEGGAASLGVMALRLSSDHVAERVVAGLRRRDKLPSASGERYLGLILLFSTETLELLAVLHDGVIQKLRVGVTTASRCDTWRGRMRAPWGCSGPAGKRAPICQRCAVSAISGR